MVEVCHSKAEVMCTRLSLSAVMVRMSTRQCSSRDGTSPDVADLQLLLHLLGEEKSGASISTETVGHNKNKGTPARPDKTPVEINKMRLKYLSGA